MKVFLAPGLFRNIKKSIIEGVKIEELNIKDHLLKDKILKLYGSDPIKLWALKETLRDRWVSINEEDYVLFYHAGKLIYAGTVYFKYPFVEEDKQLEAGSYFAESVWGKDVDGKTWPYLLFLKNVVKIDLHLPQLNEITGYNLKSVMGFIKVQEEKGKKVIEYLKQIYIKPPEKSPIETKELLQHDDIVDVIYALGELIGYKPERKMRHEGYEFDVVWNKPPRIGPKYVFEVHMKGSLEAALLRLKHAYDLWESQIFLVSTEESLKEAQSKFLGELHELKDKVILLDVKNVKEFYDFKGKFEWLERKFGLRPI